MSLFLAVPHVAKILELSKEGKKEVACIPFREPIAIKYGPHMVNMDCYFDIEPQDINLNYYDGGSATYDLLYSCLANPTQLIRFRTEGEDFGTALSELAKIFKLDQAATIFVKCDLDHLFRVTFCPAEGLKLTKYSGNTLFDDRREGLLAGMCAHQAELYRQKASRLIDLFDHTNTSVGANDFTDLFENLPSSN